MEEIAHGIVVLESVQATERYVRILGRGGCGAQLSLKRGKQVHTLCLGQPRLILRRHIGHIDHLDQLLDQFRLGKELLDVGDLL